MPQGPKIIKQQIHFQIEDYPNKKKVIYMYQSGFRRNESTDICLAKFIDFVLTDMDKQKHTGMILVDFQKAFDTFDLELLFEKNKYFGFWRSVIKWFESYLSNRQFLVSICFFWAWNIKVQCPTWPYSWTAPFSITCKCSSQSLLYAGSYLYADDTCIFYQQKDVKKN